MGDAEEPNLDIDFCLTSQAAPVIALVEFDVAEDRFYICPALFAQEDSHLGVEIGARLSAIDFKRRVDRNRSGPLAALAL